VPTLYRVLKLNPLRAIERPCGAEKVLVEFKVLRGGRPMRMCSLIIEEAKETIHVLHDCSIATQTWIRLVTSNQNPNFF